MRRFRWELASRMSYRGGTILSQSTSVDDRRTLRTQAIVVAGSRRPAASEPASDVPSHPRSDRHGAACPGRPASCGPGTAGPRARGLTARSAERRAGALALTHGGDRRGLRSARSPGRLRHAPWLCRTRAAHGEAWRGRTPDGGRRRWATSVAKVAGPAGERR